MSVVFTPVVLSLPHLNERCAVLLKGGMNLSVLTF